MVKTIEVDGRPDGTTFDPYNRQVWVSSHVAPYATVIDAATGTVTGTVDLGGEPEQAVSDGRGTIYVNLQDRPQIAVVDAQPAPRRRSWRVAENGYVTVRCADA